MKIEQPIARSRWRWLMRLSVVLALLIASCVFSRYRVAQQASWQLMEIVSRGEPTTFGQILEIYEKDTLTKDATELWTTAFEKLQSIGEGNESELDQLPYVGFADEPLESLATATDYLRERSEVVTTLHLASEIGGAARYSAESAGGFYSLMPPDGLIDANQLLQLETSLAAHQGDIRKCATALLARQALANSLANNPGNAPQAVSRAIHGLAIEDIAKYCALGFSDEQLTQFQSNARTAGDEDVLLFMCLTARAHGVSMFEESANAASHFGAYNHLLSQEQVEIPKRMLDLQFVRPHERALWSLLKPWDYRLFLDISTRLVEASKLSWPQAIDAAAATESDLEDELESATIEAAHLLTRMLVKSPSRQFNAVGRHVALVRAFDSAIAVEIYRRRNGHVPTSLDALVPEFLPEVPTDPFSGRQICYTVERDAFVCYSVGENRSDDGGNGAQAEGPDVTCRLRVGGLGRPR